MIELRSDTFTLPTPAMLAAISSARLGNDGYREDPTVIDLEQMAAARFRKGAACLMPSGTMANLACIMGHCCPDESGVLVSDSSDIYVYERDGCKCAGVPYSGVPTQPDGTLLLTDVEDQITRNARAGLRTALLCLENPHNLCGGVVLPLDYMQRAAWFAGSRRIALHLDGARIFNAAVALNVDPAEIVKGVDSIQFCLSKGLGAPIGSVVVGSAVFIEKIRRIRKILGGTMRQAGIIAAAGIVALEKMVDRLAEDHRNARHMAEGLVRLPGIYLDLKTVQTNTVVFRVTDARFTTQSFIASAWAHDVHFSEFRDGCIRAVVHCGTTAKDIEEALDVVARVFDDGPIENWSYCGTADG